MTVINVYDLSFNLIGVIDSFVSLIWRPAFYDVGDFELYLGATPIHINLLAENRLVVRSDDIEMDEAGNVTYKKVMIIKSIDLITNVENGDFISVKGKELKYILHQRVVWKQTNLSGTAEAGIRRLVNENAVNPSDSKRKIPNMVLGAESFLPGRIEKQLTGDFLDEAITEICASFKYGWDLYGYNGRFVFIVYSGQNRSYGQSERPFVVFSDAFDNLYNTEYQLNTEGYANTALIGGEGEGSLRTYTTVNNSTSGLSRYELFVDAKDLSSNKDSEDEIPMNTYLLMLQERGIEQLSEAAITEGFSGEVLSNGAFKFGVDFDLGDTVTVMNSYGISKDVMVLSAIESEDENGETLIPQFNI